MISIRWRIQLVALAAGLVALGGLPAASDTLYLQSGATVQGQVQSFDGQWYRVLLEGELVTYRAEEVRAFSIDRTAAQDNQNTETLSLILQKLDTLDYKLNSFSQQYESTADQMQQKIFDLNPISLVRVLSQDGQFDRKGNYIVRGRLLNESNEVVRYFRLRATLLDPNGVALDTLDVTPMNKTIGPGATIPYDVVFPGAPKNIGSVEIVPYLSTRSSDEDIGDYQQRSPVQRYR